MPADRKTHQVVPPPGLPPRVAAVGAALVLPLQVRGVPAYAHGVGRPRPRPQSVVLGPEAGSRPHRHPGAAFRRLGVERAERRAEEGTGDRRRRPPHAPRQHGRRVEDLPVEGHRSHVAIAQLLEEVVGRGREAQAEGHVHVLAPRVEQERPHPLPAHLLAQEHVHAPRRPHLPVAPPEADGHRGVLSEDPTALPGHPDLGGAVGARVVAVLPGPPAPAGLGHLVPEDVAVEAEELFLVLFAPPVDR